MFCVPVLSPHKAKVPPVIRRFLIVMLSMLVWTVQTADAAVDHSKQYPVSVESVVVAEAPSSEDGTEKGLACGVGCVCHAFHHAVFDARRVEADLVAGSVVFDVVVDTFTGLVTTPPIRPPLA